MLFRVEMAIDEKKISEDELIEERASVALLLACLPKESSLRIAETGCRSGHLAEEILSSHQNLASTYIGLESATEQRAAAANRMKDYGETFSSLEYAAAERFPLPDKSQDLLLSAYFLEHLRMDQLYMVFSEARRVLAPGGHWAILTRSPGGSFWEKTTSRLWSATGKRMLEMNHFISPEDWEIEIDRRISRFGLISHVFVLKRKPE